MSGELTQGFSISDSASVSRANCDTNSWLISLLWSTNLPSGRLMAQFVQTRSALLPSAVIGVGNLVTRPLRDVVLRMSQAMICSHRQLLTLSKIARNHPGCAATIVWVSVDFMDCCSSLRYSPLYGRKHSYLNVTAI